MRTFLRCHAGRGTLAVYLAAVLLGWPRSLGFWTAVGCLVFAVDQFRLAFRCVDEQHPTPRCNGRDGQAASDAGPACSLPESLPSRFTSNERTDQRA